MDTTDKETNEQTNERPSVRSSLRCSLTHVYWSWHKPSPYTRMPQKVSHYQIIKISY